MLALNPSLQRRLELGKFKQPRPHPSSFLYPHASSPICPTRWTCPPWGPSRGWNLWLGPRAASPLPRGAVPGGPAIRELPAISSRLVTFIEDSTTSQVTTTKRMESEEAGGEPWHQLTPAHCPAEGDKAWEECPAGGHTAAMAGLPLEHPGLPPRAV